METQNHQQGNEDGVNKSSNFLCRQSSTRWTPTTEQIRILKELYYNNGVRSPTAEQIQRISAKLRQYGKIEGKNVFYWFQNHKARERQKKRFTCTPSVSDVPMHHISPSSGVWKYHQDHPFPNNHNAAGFPSSSSSSPGVLNVATSYGSVAMEKSFRDCSISPGGDGNGSGMGKNFVWVGGVDPYSSGGGYHPFLEKRKYVEYETLEDELQEEEEVQDIETLPLFPIHAEHSFKQETNFYNGWEHGQLAEDNKNVGSSRASLELTLNSYSARLRNSP